MSERRRKGQAELRIDPQAVREKGAAGHPCRYVNLAVAAEYLELNERTLDKFLEAGLLVYSTHGRRRRIEVTELLAYEERQRVKPRKVG